MRSLGADRRLPAMDLIKSLKRRGGVATWAQLVAVGSATEVRASVSGGSIEKVGHNRYALPSTKKGRRAAATLHGVVSHRSAAQHWGWGLKVVPPQVDVTVRRGRNIDEALRKQYAVHWAPLGPDDVEGVWTSRLRTVLDCARSLPFDEALCVVDSALRAGQDHDELRGAAAQLRGPGAIQARAVIELGDKRAENPFESVLRLHAHRAGLDVVPQVTIAGLGRPDLVDAGRRLILEADSWTWHEKTPVRHTRDCERYNAFVIAGWLVLRFTYEHVMKKGDYVEDALRRFVDLSQRRPLPAVLTKPAA
jgi:very-short-patch-repair endonuclease